MTIFLRWVIKSSAFDPSQSPLEGKDKFQKVKYLDQNFSQDNRRRANKIRPTRKHNNLMENINFQHKKEFSLFHLFGFLGFFLKKTCIVIFGFC